MTSMACPRLPIHSFALALFLVIGALSSTTSPALAQVPEAAATPAAASSSDDGAGTVSASDAQAYLGYWELSAKLGESETKMGLVLETDREGGNPESLSGRLVSPFGEMTADRFRKTGDKLGFDLSSNLGKFLVEIEVDDDQISGVFGDEGGSLTAGFSGHKSDRLAFQRFMAPENEARIQKGDQMVRLRFARPGVESVDFAQIGSLEPGQVVRFLEYGAIKLMTDFALQFGDLLVDTENVAEDYPGVYSLWLKRTEDGWSLVFNHKPDVWGTQYDSGADLGEVPLSHSEASHAEASQSSPRLVAALEENESGARLSMSWGPHQWQTPFEIVDEASGE